MSNLYDDFEKRHTGNWFAASWIEVDAKPQKVQPQKKNLAELEAELQKIGDDIENISMKQLRLSNLAKMYNS